MKKNSWIVTLFTIAALYDGILGLIFLSIPARVFQWFDVPTLYHLGYIHFPAALLIVFAWMFVTIARNPSENRNLIPFGILLKVSYCAVVFFHWFTDGIANIWKPFAIIDLIFMALFIWAYMAVGKREAKIERC